MWRRRRNRTRGMLGNGGIYLGRLLGIDILADWSLLIIFSLITLGLGGTVFPTWHPDWTPVVTWATALGAALLLVDSVLMHELSHAVMARRYGLRVRGITLFLFGGLAHMEGDPPSPRSEFMVAIVGPLTSIAIGIVAMVVGVELAGDAFAVELGPQADAAAMREAFADTGPVATLLLWLGPTNLVLGVFNMVPGFPLDGGRVLRSILWGITNNRLKATRWASAGGQAVAWGLMALGVIDLFGGALAPGLWLLLIGWFLNNAARASYQQLLARHALENVPVARLMWTEPTRVPPDLSLEVFVRDYLMATDQIAFPVEADGELLGLVAFDDVRRVPQAQWGATSVARIMTPVRGLTSLAPDADANDALTELARSDMDQIPVIEGSRLRGLVRRRDLVKWLSLQNGSHASGT